MESFDVVVVGARCAGSALAIYLARAGMRVCLVDKAAFPSETPSTHVLHPGAWQSSTNWARWSHCWCIVRHSWTDSAS